MNNLFFFMFLVLIIILVFIVLYYVSNKRIEKYKSETNQLITEYFRDEYPIFYDQIGLKGKAVLLNPGKYTKKDLMDKFSYKMDSIKSFYVPKGFLVKIYIGENFNDKFKSFRGPEEIKLLNSDFIENIKSIIVFTPLKI